MLYMYLASSRYILTNASKFQKKFSFKISLKISYNTFYYFIDVLFFTATIFIGMKMSEEFLSKPTFLMFHTTRCGSLINKELGTKQTRSICCLSECIQY